MIENKNYMYQQRVSRIWLDSFEIHFSKSYSIQFIIIYSTQFAIIPFARSFWYVIVWLIIKRNEEPSTCHTVSFLCKFHNFIKLIKWQVDDGWCNLYVSCDLSSRRIWEISVLQIIKRYCKFGDQSQFLFALNLYNFQGLKFA